MQFKALVENQFGKKIKVMQSDWGGEFRSFTAMIQKEGILFKHSCPYTTAQNGRAERKHRHIVELGLTQLAQAWWEAFQMACS